MAITDQGCAQAFPLALHVVDGKEDTNPIEAAGYTVGKAHDIAGQSKTVSDHTGSQSPFPTRPTPRAALGYHTPRGKPSADGHG